jgi:hypothetical protein
MEGPSLYERIHINKFTPFDYIIDFLGIIEVRAGVTGRQGGMFKTKLEYYERLLNSLENGYDERIIAKYMKTPCGRTQVKLAARRGLLPLDEYCSLKKKYPLDMLEKTLF